MGRYWFQSILQLEKMVSIPLIFLRHMAPALGAAPEQVQNNVTLLLSDHFNLACRFTKCPEYSLCRLKY